METKSFTALCERAGRWWTIRVPQIEGLTAQVTTALQLRHAARQAVDAAIQATGEAIDALAREGVVFHDAATMLGLSPVEIEQYGAIVSGQAADQAPPQTTPLPAPSVPPAPSAPSSPMQLAGQ
jgi:hypothetical protein